METGKRLPCSKYWDLYRDLPSVEFIMPLRSLAAPSLRSGCYIPRPSDYYRRRSLGLSIYYRELLVNACSPTHTFFFGLCLVVEEVLWGGEGELSIWWRGGGSREGGRWREWSMGWREEWGGVGVWWWWWSGSEGTSILTSRFRVRTASWFWREITVTSIIA